MPFPDWLTQQSAGTIEFKGRSWVLKHDPNQKGSLRVTRGLPLAGDFDAVVKVDPGDLKVGDGQGVYVGLEAVGNPDKNQAYILLGSHYRHGRRFAADLRVDTRWGAYRWHRTDESRTWLRLIRKNGLMEAHYYYEGEWVRLDRFKRRLEGELFLGMFSTTDWEAKKPAAFSPVFTLERLVTDASVGAAYTPPGYALLEKKTAPAVPKGMTAELYQTPYPVMSPFFDDLGNLYLLPAAKKKEAILRLKADGTSDRFWSGKAVTGLNGKCGLWLGRRLLLTVDGWRDGGNALNGLYELKPGGKFREIPMKRGHAGLASLNAGPNGELILSDFENDGIWRLHPDGRIEELLAKRMPCAVGVAIDRTTGKLYFRNNSEGYTCGGTSGIFLIKPDGQPEQIFAAQDNKNLGGLIWLPRGLFPRGLYVTVPDKGRLLRLESGGKAQVVLEGLGRPGALATDRTGSVLAIQTGESEVLVIGAGKAGKSRAKKKIKFW